MRQDVVQTTLLGNTGSYSEVQLHPRVEITKRTRRGVRGLQTVSPVILGNADKRKYVRSSPGRAALTPWLTCQPVFHQYICPALQKRMSSMLPYRSHLLINAAVGTDQTSTTHSRALVTATVHLLNHFSLGNARSEQAPEMRVGNARMWKQPCAYRFVLCPRRDRHESP